MRSVTAAVWACAFATLGVVASRAQTTSFAGTWIIDWSKTDAANAALGSPSQPHGATVTQTIRQDAQSLTVERAPAPPRSYRLDGSATTYRTNGGATQVVRVSWDGARLKFVITSGVGDAAKVATKVWELDHGDLLETTTWPPANGAAPERTAEVSRRVSR